jgi:PAS domain S-box-containing protein
LEATQRGAQAPGVAVLLQVGDEADALISNAVAGRIVLSRAQAPNELFEVLEAASSKPHALVIGTGVDEPVRVVQRARSSGADMAVLILTERERREQLAQTLRFAPFIGHDVTPWSRDDLGKLPDVLVRSVERALKRRHFKGSIAEAQRHLGRIPNGTPQVTHFVERLLDRAPIGVLNVDVHGTILSLNRYACQVLAASERDALGTVLTQFLPETEHIRFRNLIARCVAPMRKRMPEILEIRSEAGAWRHVEVIASSLVDRTGQLGATLILQDVTDRVLAERKRQAAEAALRAGERRYRELVETMNEGLAMTDAHYRITFVNRTFCQMFALDASEVLGRPLLDLVHAQDKDMMRERIASRSSCASPSFETAWTGGDGRMLYTLTSPRHFFDEQGAFTGCLGVFTDITERRRVAEELRQSEAQLRLVTDAIPVLIVYLDRAQRLRFFNRAFADWYGLNDSGKGALLGEVIGTATHRKVQPLVEAALGGEPVECEMAIAFRGQVSRDVRCSLIPDSDQEDRVRGIVAVITDITERKRIEQWERQHLLELSHVSRVTTIGQMSSQIAHELSQPLTAINGLSTALVKLRESDSASPDEVNETLREISGQAKRAREIVIRLRDFVRRSEIRYIAIDMNETIRTVVRLANVEASHQRIRVELVLAQDLPEVSADRVLIEQVLLNLVRNAVDAMEALPGDARHLRIASEAPDVARVRVSVTDNGTGLTDELIPNLFEPFFTTKDDGMGMGLAITRSIIQAHDGVLEAHNNPDAGATFRFTLPTAPAANGDGV